MNTRVDHPVNAQGEGAVMRRKGTMGCLLFLFAVAMVPEPAAAADVTLYEIIENMSMVRHGGNEHRLSWAALAGMARPGTVLCPLPATAPGELEPQPGAIPRPNQDGCTIHATGLSSVKVATGEGTFRGDFTVVAAGDNDVDGPEAVVLKGDFNGIMDFSPAFLAGQPYGLVFGTLGIAGGPPSPFTGVFHLPFVLREDRTRTPHYLGFTGLRPNGTVVPVGANERALGRPTVKFEICLGLTCDGIGLGSGLPAPPDVRPGLGLPPPPVDLLATRG
jgi:hypothetical protein